MQVSGRVIQAHGNSRRLGFFKGRSGLVLQPTVEQMAEAQPGVLPQHARTCVAHDHLDFLPTVALIAMDGAPGTGGLLFAEPTMLQAQGDIMRQVLTIWA